MQQISKSIEKIDPETAKQVESQRFQSLYQLLLSKVGPSIAEEYYKTGMDAYQKEMYEDAITALSKAAEYDAENVDILYNLGNAYRQNGDKDNAVQTYQLVIDKFDGTDRARRAKNYLAELNEG